MKALEPKTAGGHTNGRTIGPYAGLLSLFWALSVFGLVIVLNVRRAMLEPLVRYGFSGAEYLELLQLGHARALLGGDSGWAALGRISDYLVLLDGEYPPGLHILAAGWERVARIFGRAEPLLFARELNLGWSCLLGLGTYWLATTLTGSGPREGSEGPEAAPADPLPGLLAATGVLLAPCTLGAGHRYYYDLPMTALCTVALAALCSPSRRAGPLAGLVTGLALLVKWQSGLYLLPAWGSSLLLAALRREPSKTGRVSDRVLGGLVCLGLISPLVARGHWGALGEGQLPWTSETSLGMAVLQARGVHGRSSGWDVFQLTRALLGPIGLVGWGGLVLSGAGRGGAVFSSRMNRFPLGVVLGAFLGAAAWLGVGGARLPDERYLMPLVPQLAALWTVWLREGRGLFSGQNLHRASGRTAPRWTLVVAGIILSLTAWGVQILEFEGILTLPRPLRSSPSLELRGWSPLGQAPGAHPDEYIREAGAVCRQNGQDHQIVLVTSLGEDALHAWRWALLRECPRISVEVNTMAKQGQQTVQTTRLEPSSEGLTRP